MNKRTILIIMITLSFFLISKKNVADDLIPAHSFTSGIEGPAFDDEGNLFVVNFSRQGTIGKIDPQGNASIYLTLPDSSVGNGIEFDSNGTMYIADYVNHNVFRYVPEAQSLTVIAHEPAMNQPNDLAIMKNGILFASDPNWADGSGQLWRISKEGKTTLLERNMGTTNGVAVSPDGQYLYVNESVQRRVWRYNLDAKGNISHKTLIHTFADFGLDGMQCDEHGNLYIARYGAGNITVLSPDGELIGEIALRGKFPTNVAMHEGRLYVTMQKRGTVEVISLDQALSPSSGSAQKVIIGYVFSGGKPISASDIDATKLTHVNYAFSRVVDNKVTNGFASDNHNYRELQKLKAINPDIKILSSVGGWTWSDTFSEMASSAESRTTFVTSAVEFIKTHQLDGIDIDWEYPGLPGNGNPHKAEDGDNFTLLLKQLRSALDTLETQTGRSLLLTIASGGFPAFIEKSAIHDWQQYLDYINIMAYDFHVANGNNVTDHHAGLYSNPASKVGLSADAAVKQHLAAGVPAHKLVLGVAFYGRSWMNVTADNNGLFQGGSINTHQYGGDAFRNLATILAGESTAIQGFKRYWDNTARAPYLWHPEKRIFISYDDEQSITLKGQYVKAQGLAGIMFWSYNSDYEQQLLNAINDALTAP